MSRLAAVGGKLVLAAGLLMLVGWPAAATVLEATAPLWRTREGGAEEVPSVALDPTSTASVINQNRGFSRPAALAIETIRLVAETEAMAMPVGILLGVLLFRTDIPGRRLVLAILALSAFVPMPLHATAWLGALGNAGRTQVLGLRPILVGSFGAAVVHAIAALPWVVLLTGVGLLAVEPELEESARLESSAWRVLWVVTLRRSVGAIGAAALAVAVLTAGDMTVTDLLRVRTYAEEAYVQFILGKGLADAAVVALPPLVVLGFAILLAARAMSQYDPARLTSGGAGMRAYSLGRWRTAAGGLLILTVGNAVAFPLYGMIWRAGRVGGRATLGQPPTWSLLGLEGTLARAAGEVSEPLFASLAWASIAATVVVILVFGLAWAGRSSRSWRWAMLGALALALATPGPVTGRALVLAYRDVPLLYDSSAIVVMAQALRALPYVILVLWPFVRSFPRDYLDAAALEGRGPVGRMAWVAAPLSARPIVAAWLVALALGLGELAATDQVYPPGVEPMSVFLWGLLHTGIASDLAGVALIMLAAIAAAGLAAALAIGRSRREVGWA
ncbi:MAG: ABC transporter permease [Isosphaeraceae bacterium]